MRVSLWELGERRPGAGMMAAARRDKDERAELARLRKKNAELATKRYALKCSVDPHRVAVTTSGATRRRQPDCGQGR
jgi:hypothetical protein